MEAVHIIKPLGAKPPKLQDLMDEFPDHEVWVVSSGSMKVKGEISSSQESAVKAWNEFFSKAPKVYGYE